MKKREAGRRRRRDAGMSAVEVLVGVLLFGTAVLAVIATTAASRRSLASARNETQYWGAVQGQIERLMAQDYDSVTSGSGSVYGHPMSWKVSDSSPKRIELTAKRPGLAGRIDTVLVLLGDPAP